MALSAPPQGYVEARQSEPGTEPLTARRSSEPLLRSRLASVVNRLAADFVPDHWSADRVGP